MRSFLNPGLKERDIDDIVTYLRAFRAGAATAQRARAGERVARTGACIAYSVEEPWRGQDRGRRRQHALIVCKRSTRLCCGGQGEHDQTIVYSATWFPEPRP